MPLVNVLTAIVDVVPTVAPTTLPNPCMNGVLIAACFADSQASAVVALKSNSSP